MRSLSVKLICIVVVLVIGAYVLAFMPLPIKRTVFSEDLPDGTMTAIYSYRPAGLIGWVQKDSSYVYLDVYRKAPKEHLLHSEAFGDVPGEAVDRLHQRLPWPARRTTGQPSDSSMFGPMNTDSESNKLYAVNPAIASLLHTNTTSAGSLIQRVSSLP